MAYLRNFILAALLVTAQAPAWDQDRIAEPGIESRDGADEQVTDSQLRATVWLIFTLICTGQTCRHADYAPPLAFHSKAACISFAIEAHKQGMPYVCEPAAWGDASETETRKML